MQDFPWDNKIPVIKKNQLNYSKNANIGYPYKNLV